MPAAVSATPMPSIRILRRISFASRYLEAWAGLICVHRCSSVVQSWSSSNPLQPQIRRQPLQPALPAKAAFLVAAEGAGRVEFVVGVSPYDSRPKFAGHFENLAPLIGPDACA